MIEYIHGDLTELTPALAVVETAGWAIGLNIYRSILYCHSGQTGYTYTSVHEVLVAGGRDDSFTFAFATKQER